MKILKQNYLKSKHDFGVYLFIYNILLTITKVIHITIFYKRIINDKIGEIRKTNSSSLKMNSSVIINFVFEEIAPLLKCKTTINLKNRKMQQILLTISFIISSVFVANSQESQTYNKGTFGVAVNGVENVSFVDFKRVKDSIFIERREPLFLKIKF